MTPCFPGIWTRFTCQRCSASRRTSPYFVDADEVIQGGSGYCISLVNGKEVFDKSKDIPLPP